MLGKKGVCGVVAVVGLLQVCLVLVLAADVQPQEPHYRDGAHNEAFHKENPDHKDDEPEQKKELSPREIIEDLVANHDVVVFSKSYCPYCRRAKGLLAEEKIPHKVLELDQHALGAQIQQTLAEMTGQRTVPSVWVKGKHLGGNDATQAAHKSGKLKELLSQPRTN